ncbi:MULTISPECIES: MFS transporter [Mesoplasma]|uniref:MFS transporter n=1 Tax=Mesoplasma TaxID=46239 RepID=UPI00068F379B|nr:MULTISPECIES: MFS transporter [Mesoplasma]
MQQRKKNKEMKENKFWQTKKFWIIAILATADVLVFIFPSYLKNVINTEIISLNLGISPSQLAQASAVYGYVSLFIYFFGSVIADKISLKWLTITGLAAFGISGVWYGSVGLTAGGGIIFDIENNVAVLNPIGQSSRYTQVLIIYVIWAFAKIIFWAPLWKLLSQQGKPEENGILNGIHGSLNGLIGTIFVAVGFIIFIVLTPIFVNKNSTSTLAFSLMCYLFCLLILIDVLLLIFFVKEKKGEAISKDFNIKEVGKVLKNYKVYLLALLVMGVYMYQQGLSVLIPFMNTALLISASVTFVGGLLRTYLFRLFFSAPAGKIADKSGKYIKFLVVGCIICSLLMLLIIFLPGFKVGGFVNQSTTIKILIQVVVYSFFLCMGAICWGLVTNRWATIYEIGIDHKQYATAVGLVSVIAFSPDAWFWQLNSLFLEKYKIETGVNGIYNYQLAYQYSMILIVAGGILGIISGLVLMYMIKKDKKRKKLNKY